ncbi:MAG: hypothetical protein Q4B71_01420 [Cardiobacteriaceae bacterium]|nr:hypothetical protein [Cardiobacteriaceae bacterium]
MIGNKTVKAYLQELNEEGYARFTKAAKLNDAWQFLTKFQEIWLQYTQTNQRMMVCINQARRNYHSRLYLALMGI